VKGGLGFQGADWGGGGLSLREVLSAVHQDERLGAADRCMGQLRSRREAITGRFSDPVVGYWAESPGELPEEGFGQILV
jgi:hypothetical protein